MLTAKQEAFAIAVATGESQANAYRQAYNANDMLPETIWSRASDVAKKSKVSARVEELRQPAANKAQVTLERHLEALRVLGEKAAEAGLLSAAIRAEELRGKAVGLYGKRVDVDLCLTREEILTQLQ